MPRYAAIDIGTNTVLMVIAEVRDDGTVHILSDKHGIARLGENVHSSNKISSEALSRASRILADYHQLCKEFAVDKILACGTSALRDASNRDDVKNAFADILHTDINIISGEDEARLSFIGSVEDDENNLLIDIGGGSTEFIIGNKSKILFRQSINIGAVRLTEQFISNHPPDSQSLTKLKQAIRRQIESTINPKNKFSNIYAVAGTPTTIAAIAMGLLDYSDNKVNGYVLRIDEMKDILNLFIRNHTDYLINHLLIHPQRADVITAGTMILIESLEHIRRDSCIVSSKGLRYGILKSMINA